MDFWSNHILFISSKIYKDINYVIHECTSTEMTSKAQPLELYTGNTIGILCHDHCFRNSDESSTKSVAIMKQTLPIAYMNLHDHSNLAD